MSDSIQLFVVVAFIVSASVVIGKWALEQDSKQWDARVKFCKEHQADCTPRTIGTEVIYLPKGDIAT